MLDKSKFQNVEFFERASALPFSEVVRHASVIADNTRGPITAETETFTGVCYEMVRQAAERVRVIEPAIKYFVRARLWTDTNGNTYRSVRIADSNMDELVYIPFTYGYGDQWTQTALEWFKAQGIEFSLHGTRALREELRADYESRDVQRKRDL